jgi:hypothetical protein
VTQSFHQMKTRQAEQDILSWSRVINVIPFYYFRQMP